MSIFALHDHQGAGKGKRVRLAPSEGDLQAMGSAPLQQRATPGISDMPVPMAVDNMGAPSTSGRMPIPLGDVKLPLELNTRVGGWS